MRKESGPNIQIKPVGTVPEIDKKCSRDNAANLFARRVGIFKYAFDIVSFVPGDSEHRGAWIIEKNVDIDGRSHYPCRKIAAKRVASKIEEHNRQTDGAWGIVYER